MKLKQTNLKILRESASLILAAKTNFPQPTKFNYKLLCLQRSSESKVLANNYVFPGGNISKSDSSISWMKLFGKFGFGLDYFEKIYPTQYVPSIFEETIEGNLPKHLSLRICAIRETFEECGILICRSNRINYKNFDWASYIGGCEIAKWQRRVHDDPYQFLSLCTQLDVYPDLWSLHTWSNWLTPQGVPARYNTMFFLCSFNQPPSIHKDEKEIQNTRWALPEEYIEEDLRQTIALPVPQFYEISRIRNFPNIESLTKHAKERSNNGCEKYFPLRIGTKEGIYYIFPGDELYVDNSVNSSASLDEIQDCKIQNRLLVTGTNLKKLFVRNCVPKDGHIPPNV